MTGESREEIVRDIETARRIAAVRTLLQLLCETTGMGFEGLGLGLNICSQIVRAHAGRLSAESGVFDVAGH